MSEVYSRPRQIWSDDSERSSDFYPTATASIGKEHQPSEAKETDLTQDTGENSSDLFETENFNSDSDSDFLTPFNSAIKKPNSAPGLRS